MFKTYMIPRIIWAADTLYNVAILTVYISIFLLDNVKDTESYHARKRRTLQKMVRCFLGFQSRLCFLKMLIQPSSLTGFREFCIHVGECNDEQLFT